MITKDNQLAEKLTINDVMVIVSNLDAVESWQWQKDNPKRPEMKVMDVWKLKQKRFVSQILASLTAKIGYNKKLIERLTVSDAADALQLPESFIKNIKLCITKS